MSETTGSGRFAHRGEFRGAILQTFAPGRDAGGPGSWNLDREGRPQMAPTALNRLVLLMSSLVLDVDPRLPERMLGDADNLTRVGDGPVTVRQS